MHKQQWSDQEFQDTFYTIQFAVTVTSFINMKAETIKEETSETLISDKTQLRNTIYESTYLSKCQNSIDMRILERFKLPNIIIQFIMIEQV